MRIQSNARHLLALAEAAFDLAVDDTLELARAHARKNAMSGEFAASLQRTPTVNAGGRLSARIGSPHSSARGKELGAFITAKSKPYMRFQVRPSGDWVTMESFRIPAQPAVAPAGTRFPQLYSARLSAINLTGSGTASSSGRPDLRGGGVRVTR